MKYYIPWKAIRSTLQLATPHSHYTPDAQIQDFLSAYIEYYVEQLHKLTQTNNTLNFDVLCSNVMVDEVTHLELRQIIITRREVMKQQYYFERTRFPSFYVARILRAELGEYFTKEDLHEVALYITYLCETALTDWATGATEWANKYRSRKILAKHVTIGILQQEKYWLVFRNKACYAPNWSLSFTLLPAQPLEALDPGYIGSANRLIKSNEDNYRAMFVSDRENPSSPIQNPYLHLMEVFAHRDEFCLQKLDSEEQKIPQLLILNKKKKVNCASIVDNVTFLRNWSLLVGNLFDNLNWKNIFAAGGAVLGCLLPNFEKSDYTWEPNALGWNGFADTDIDLFIYGVDVENARKKVKELVNTVKANSKNPIKIMRSNYAITICGIFPERNVQLVLRLYKSPAEGLSQQL